MFLASLQYSYHGRHVPDLIVEVDLVPILRSTDGIPAGSSENTQFDVTSSHELDRVQVVRGFIGGRVPQQRA